MFELDSFPHPPVVLLISMMDFVLTISGTVLGAFIIAAGAAFWRMSGDMKLIRQTLQTMGQDWDRRFGELSKDVEYLKGLIDQQRKWRWESGSHHAEAKEDRHA